MLSRRAFLAASSIAALRGAPSSAFVRVSPRDRRYLELSDGSPFIPIGLNLITPPERGGLQVYQDWLTSPFPRAIVVRIAS